MGERWNLITLESSMASGVDVPSTGAMVSTAYAEVFVLIQKHKHEIVHGNVDSLQAVLDAIERLTAPNMLMPLTLAEAMDFILLVSKWHFEVRLQSGDLNLRSHEEQWNMLEPYIQC